MWCKAQHQISMEHFYVFMVNSFWDSANIVSGCLRESTHLHLLWQCQMIVQAFKHHMNERQSCLKALKQCGLNWISTLEMRGRSIAWLPGQEWTVRGKLMWEWRMGIANPKNCGHLLLLYPPSYLDGNLPFSFTDSRGWPGFPTHCCRQWHQQGHSLFTSPFASSFSKLPHNLLPLAFLWQHSPSLVAHLTGPQILPRKCGTGQAVIAISTIIFFSKWFINKAY